MNKQNLKVCWLSAGVSSFPRLGRITKHCENCGQALQMESDSTDQ